MQEERFRSLLAVPGPFASLYFDDFGDAAESAEQLQNRWRDMRAHFGRLGADPNVVAALEQEVLQHKPLPGRRGRALIAAGTRVLVNESLIGPPPATVLRWSDYPYLLPLAAHGMARPPYVFAAVDHAGADLIVHAGDTVTSESIGGEGYPVHKPATAGWNGYRDLQRTTEEAVRMNVRAVVTRLTHLVEQAGVEAVFVCGEVSARSAVVSALPHRVAARVAQLRGAARNGRVRQDQVDHLVDKAFAEHRNAEITGIAERFAAETGRRSGLAAEGLVPVCAALRAGDVSTLIVGRIGDATVVTGKSRATVAPGADALSEWGEPVYRVARADEALPFAAVAVGARVIPAGDLINPIDGIGALLRYAPAAPRRSAAAAKRFR
jgi:hypothetical protein